MNEHRSAPVLTAGQVDAARSWTCSSAEMRRDWEALCESHEALRAELEAVRADRDSLWTTVNKVKAERDAALAEVARLKALMVPCGVAEDKYRNRTPRFWGDTEEAALALLLDECIKVAKEVQP